MNISMTRTSWNRTALRLFSWLSEEGSGGSDFEDLVFSYLYMVGLLENVTCIGSR